MSGGRICRTCRHWEARTGLCAQWRSSQEYRPGLGQVAMLRPAEALVRGVEAVQVETLSTFGCNKHKERP